MTFQQKLDNIIERNNSLLCVGLDPVLEKLPNMLQNSETPFFDFAKEIIDATHDLVCCYKPNSAFYEARGEKGVGELKMICDYLVSHYPDIPVLLDFKRGDIGNTNLAYAKLAFEYLGVDGVTLHPYQGIEALKPFLDYKDKGLFILCKTSNPGSDEFQNLKIEDEELYKIVARNVSGKWNSNSNCFLVVGATYPKELAEVRKIVGDMILLVPGLGKQGGEIEELMNAGLNTKKRGVIINSSREVLYASSGKDFAEKAMEKAKELRNNINKYR